MDENKEKLQLSIIIPVYNQEKDLLEICIRSAINQSNIEKEIIIVDDGSTNDAVLAVCLKLFGVDIHGKYDGIIYEEDGLIIKYFYKENGGVSSALNLAIKNCQYNYISWLSSDDYFYSEKSYVQLSNMIESKTMFSFTGFRDIQLRLGKPHTIFNHVPAYGFAIVDKETLHGDLKACFPSCPICGDTVIFHKDVVKKVGNFNKDFLYTQDYEMWLRISKEYDALCCGDIFMVHHTHENQMMHIFGDEHFKNNRDREEVEIKAKYL